MKVRPDISASLATSFAYEPRLDVGQPDVVGPRISADRNGMAAAIVGAVHEDPVHATLAHLSEGDLLRAGEGGHAPLKRGGAGRANDPI
jgi:hypothetical protein